VIRILKLAEPYSITLFCAILIAALGCQKAGGLTFPVISPFLAVWFFWRLFSSSWRPGTLRPHLINTAIWLPGIFLILVLQHHYAITARRNADHLLALVNQFQQQHGQYPINTEQLDNPAFKTHRGMSEPSYLNNQGRPVLMYASTFMPFSIYQYNFSHKQWEIYNM
jgi:hypothetical protein